MGFPIRRERIECLNFTIYCRPIEGYLNNQRMWRFQFSAKAEG